MPLPITQPHPRPQRQRPGIINITPTKPVEKAAWKRAGRGFELKLLFIALLNEARWQAPELREHDILDLYTEAVAIFNNEFQDCVEYNARNNEATTTDGIKSFILSCIVDAHQTLSRKKSRPLP